ncbi:hypothetical protein SB7C_12405, partial [Staphylococcus epidermidis]
LHHEPEARIDDAPDQIEAAEQAGQAQIIELVAIRQVDQSGEVAALVDGEPVVAAVTRQAGGDVIGHLREGQRDHDEIDAAGAQAERADHQREQRRDDERHRPLDETGADALGGEDADGIATDAEIGGVAEAHHAAIAHDQIEARRGQREDHDAGEQREDEDVAGDGRIGRQQEQGGAQQRRDRIGGVELGHHRLAAGNSPSGRNP